MLARFLLCAKWKFTFVWGPFKSDWDVYVCKKGLSIHLQSLFSLLPDFRNIRRQTNGITVPSHFSLHRNSSVHAWITPMLNVHPFLPTKKFNFPTGTRACWIKGILISQQRKAFLKKKSAGSSIYWWCLSQQSFKRTIFHRKQFWMTAIVASFC